MRTRKPPGNGTDGFLPDDAAILAGVLTSHSLDISGPVQFIRPYALSALTNEDIWRVIENACWEIFGEALLDWTHKQHVGKRGPIVKDHGKTLEDMRKLLEDLEADLDHCVSTQRKHNVDLGSDAKALRLATETLQKSIDAIENLVTSAEAGLQRPPPNTRLFSAAYVRSVRKAWHRITGKPAGTARDLPVEFAAELWEAIGLPDRGSQTPTRDWLFERFKNVG